MAMKDSGDHRKGGAAGFIKRIEIAAGKTQLLWSIFGITLLMIIALEGGLAAFFSVEEHVANKLLTSTKNSAQNGNGQPEELKEYFDEISKAHNIEWVPYLYWRRKPFDGKYIKIDSNGIRKTWNAPNKKDAINIFMFGGSTLWGYGARDDFTIPSHLSKLLAQNTRFDVRVVNMGETGYVSTQELVAFTLELQKGNKPDIAVFYDGINDVAAALLNKKAGVTFHEKNRQAEFNLTNEERSGDLYLASLSMLVKKSNIFTAISRIKGIKEPGPPYETGSPDAEKLASEVADVYGSSVSVIGKIGRASGAKTLFYWQPVVFTKDSPSPREKEIIAELEFLDYFHKTVNEHIKSDEALNANANFHDITGVFNGLEERQYIDYMHLSEAGNGLVAKRIYGDILGILESKSTAKTGGNGSDAAGK